MTFETVDEAIASIKAHPMCSLFVETMQRYSVYYPRGNGLTIARTGDDVRTLNLLYKRLPTS